MEKAFATLKAGNKNVNIQKTIGEGGSLRAGIEVLTGKKAQWYSLGNTPMQVTKQNLDAGFDSSGNPKMIVTAAINKENDYGLPNGHAYSVIWWNGHDLGIRNPWGWNARTDDNLQPWKKQLRKGPKGEDPYKLGVFTFSLREFHDVFEEICFEGP